MMGRLPRLMQSVRDVLQSGLAAKKRLAAHAYLAVNVVQLGQGFSRAFDYLLAFFELTQKPLTQALSLLNHFILCFRRHPGTQTHTQQSVVSILSHQDDLRQVAYGRSSCRLLARNRSAATCTFSPLSGKADMTPDIAEGPSLTPFGHQSLRRGGDFCAAGGLSISCATQAHLLFCR